MELIDTPNPNARKIVMDTSVFDNPTAKVTQDNISKELSDIEGVSSVFFGPGFVTITKLENIKWETINQNIIDIFDKL
tara:strand:+ start:457 stop:690 length:234 start_codon:yes stop_codon:yes gene_type:complete